MCVSTNIQHTSIDALLAQSIYIYTNIRIYVCVCVCVCVSGGSRGVRKTRTLVVGLSNRDRPTKDLDLSLARGVSLDRGYPVLPLILRPHTLVA